MSKIPAYTIELLRRTRLVNGVLKYHLPTLEKSDVIRVVRQPRTTRYYPVTVSDKEYNILKFVRHKPVRHIIIFLLERDLCTFNEIVDHMQKAPSTVSLHIRRLREGGMISIRHGEHQLYSLTNKDIVCEMLAKYKGIFTGRVAESYEKNDGRTISQSRGNRNTGLKPTLTSLTIIVVSVLLLAVVGIDNKVLADSLKNGASKQRIGNYDVEMITDPKSPVVGSSISILLRISGVNGDHLVDVPATIRIVKDGAEIQQTNPIIVPFGHYTHHFTFEQGGTYTVYVDINDYTYSGEILTFTFFINVAGAYDYLFVVAPIGVGIAVATIILLAFVKKKRTEKKKQAAEQS